ncbi:hypothetical protein CI238_09538 [Colletotrichum incanum]|uniref:Uncharacterized protein n=1 Tax=Colletotrichum incanum TaxID=1573173 RepID=A0A161W5R4_COLIC|nr:hypothetical protein CI238_09538 [Colletotrichum incanum]
MGSFPTSFSPGRLTLRHLGTSTRTSALPFAYFLLKNRQYAPLLWSRLWSFYAFAVDRFLCMDTRHQCRWCPFKPCDTTSTAPEERYFLFEIETDSTMTEAVIACY